MRAGSIEAKDLPAQGRRLTGGFHLAEDQQIMRHLDHHVKLGAYSRLNEVVTGRGVFRGPIFKRIFAPDPALGRPYVSAADLVQADFKPTRFLSVRHGGLLDELDLQAGMILVTRSGMNLGRAIWVRDDMQGLCASDDLIRIEPDSSKIHPGYLFAFLASRHGRISIRKQIYGGNIKHVEPHHISELPVPRFGRDLEQRVHQLVIRAAAQRTKALECLRDAVGAFQKVAGLPPLLPVAGPPPFGVRAVSSRDLQRRLDAQYHSAQHVDILAELSKGSTMTLREAAKGIVEPTRFKRVQIDSPEFGVPLFGTSALTWVEPEANYFLPTSMPDIDNYVVDKTTVLIPRSGQLTGVIGTAVLPYGEVLGGAVSEHAIRIHCHSQRDAGYLFVALRSGYGTRQLKSRAYGSSIPSLDVRQVGEIILPSLPPADRAAIADLSLSATKLRHDAIRLDVMGRKLVENAIEEAN